MYEAVGAGPFVHRRIIFRATIPWAGVPISERPVVAGSSVGRGEFVRPVVSDLSSENLCGGIRRLFSQDTIRGIIQGPLNTVTINVISDEKFSFNGSDDGVRRTKKFWNSFKRTVPHRYKFLTDGVFDSSLANSPDAQHIYIADIFSYGLGDLDTQIPAPIVTPVGSTNLSEEQADGKRRKVSADSEMSDFTDVSSMKNSLPGPVLMKGNADINKNGGLVSVTTEAKLYYRMLKS